MEKRSVEHCNWRQQCNRIVIPDELIKTLEEGPTVAILSTFSAEGIPFAAPIQFIYPINEESFLIAIEKFSRMYIDIVWRKKATICFIENNNVSYSITGRAGVVAAPSMSHPLIHLVRFDIITVKKSYNSLIDIHYGVTWSYASKDAHLLSEVIFEELKEVAKEL